ncbi:MAG: class II aldolase/adducin family protein [Xenococcaceae cyanobacterium]
MTIDEGYVKYQCNWTKALPIAANELLEINRWRNNLYKLNLIGEYENGIGFGNISIRSSDRAKSFIVSGTSTGSIPCLNEQHYTTVVDFDWDKNFVTCVGPIASSSESLTHAAIYQANLNINAVIHVHHLQLWQNLLDRVPTTARNCAYGTPEMAKEIIRLCREERVKDLKIIAMSGHEEGIITFGSNLDEAGGILLGYFERST